MKPFIPSLVWALVILSLSTSAGIQVPEVVASPDKIGHIGAYGLLAWLVFAGLRKADKWSVKTGIWAIVVVSLYGMVLEIVQWAFFPHRFFEVWDMIANITGACLSFLLFRFFTFKT